MALTINDIRQKYPQYDHLSDQDIADRMHERYYSQIPKEEFYSKVGFKPEGEFTKIGHGIQDAAGAIAGQAQKAGSALLEGGEYVSRKLGEKLSKEMGNPIEIPKWNAREFMGLEGDNLVDLQKMIAHDPNSVTSKLWEYAPQIAGGGMNIGKQAIAAGVNKLLTGEPDEKSMLGQGRLPSAIQDTLMTMLGGKAVEAIPSVASKANELMRPNAFAKSIMDYLGAGRTLEQHAKDFASQIKQTYEDVKGTISKKYDKFFNKNEIGNQKLYTADEIPEFPSANGSERYENALKAFNADPSIKNAHYLQSELASEERMLEKQIKRARSKGEPVTQISADLKLTKNSRKELLDKMHDQMGDVANEYKEITKDYLENVVPYHGDRNLRNIIFGQNTNPTQGNFRSIFKNPDADTERVMSHLGLNAKNNILFQAIGKQPEDITGKTLARRIADLNSSGFESHIGNELKKNVKSINLSGKIAKALPYALLAPTALASPYAAYRIGKSLLGD